MELEARLMIVEQTSKNNDDAKISEKRRWMLSWLSAKLVTFSEQVVKESIPVTSGNKSPIPKLSLEAILMGSSKVMVQNIVDLFKVAMKFRHKEILYWYCYYKVYKDQVGDVKSKNGIDDKLARTLNGHVTLKTNKIEMKANPLGVSSSASISLANITSASQFKSTYDHTYFYKKILNQYSNLNIECSHDDKEIEEPVVGLTIDNPLFGINQNINEILMKETGCKPWQLTELFFTMDFVTGYYNDLNTYKNENASFLTTTFNEEKLMKTSNINKINKMTFSYDNLLEANKELYTHATLVLQITKQQNEITNNTFTLTEDILSKLKRKEILRFKDKISAFNNIIKRKLGFDDYHGIVQAFNMKIYNNKVDFGKEYDDYLLNLKKILKEVKMSLEEFELLFRLKKESNFEFYQNEIQTLDEAKKDLETEFSEDLKDFKNLLRKLINALESW
ncbi:hypothetical protein C1645_837185 [Glomus cerebriforme]|uniref:Uncharacterized protein n=1 Tax=Glomus cerebriforme TaxID=658196 RepID=A0A397S4K8_9GLOM|nr:hypothetical protein C1645_837185 [Glomus cerebriforme]